MKDNMDIRKIIKEEVDSFDWVSEVPEITVGSKFRNDNNTYTF